MYKAILLCFLLSMPIPAFAHTHKLHTDERTRKVKKSRISKSGRKKSPFYETDPRMRNINRLQVGMAITRCILYAGLVVAVVAGAIKTLFF